MNREILLNLKKAVNFAEASLELQNLTLLEKEMYYGVLTIIDQNNELFKEKFMFYHFLGAIFIIIGITLSNKKKINA